MTETIALSILSAALTAVLGAIPGLREALPEDARAAVDALLARAKATLPAAGAARAAIASIFGPPAPPPKNPRISQHHAAVLRRLAQPTSSALLSHEERHALAELTDHVEFVTADTDLPPVLAAPAGAWTEPSSGED